MIDFEGLCAGDPKALAAVATGFRLNLAQVERVKLDSCESKASAQEKSGKRREYSRSELAVAKQFFRGRSVLYPHAGSEMAAGASETPEQSSRSGTPGAAGAAAGAAGAAGAGIKGRDVGDAAGGDGTVGAVVFKERMAGLAIALAALPTDSAEAAAVRESIATLAATLA